MELTADEHAERKPRWRRTVGALSWLIAIALAIGWFVYLRPAGMGGPTGYVIVSGASMEPLMQTGDLAIVHRKETYRAGDIVAYRIPKQDVGGGMLVIHRVVGGSVDDGLILQGDNRETRDMWRPRGEDIVGRLQWHVPHAGTAMFLLRTPLVIAGVVGFLGFWAVLTWPEKRRETEPDPILVDEPAPQVVPPPPRAIPPPGRPKPADVASGLVVAASVIGFLFSRASRA